MNKKIKVRMTFTVEVDPDGWMDEYGASYFELRDNVKSYFTTLLYESHPVADAQIAEIEVRD